jgi:putative SOS response-associated peptidase YedK
MCGRFTLHHDVDEIVERFDVADVEFDLDARYNIAPSQIVAAIVQNGRRRLAGFKWGLQSLFAFAGLWEEWRAEDGAMLQTCTIITVEPNEMMAAIHHRMAAILKPEEEAVWLNPATAKSHLLGLLRPYPDDDFEAVPVSRLVNSPSVDSPDCIAAVAATD